MTGFKIDEEAIRKLADLLDDTGLTEIEIEEGSSSIRVCRGGGVAAAVPAAASAAVAAAPAPVAGDVAASEDSGLPAGTQVTAPMVGTVYLSSAPGSPPLVNVGDTVKEGDTLLIVEAMKVMNPIKAPAGGKVVRIAVSDAQPVEFGEVLVIIE